MTNYSNSHRDSMEEVQTKGSSQWCCALMQQADVPIAPLVLRKNEALYPQR